MRLYRDPVHGDILLTPLAADIIDTPEFQRLSRVMQLGFASLVYRGATHTRFAHSIGTYWVSREILRHIRDNHRRLDLPLPEGLGRPGAAAGGHGASGLPAPAASPGSPAKLDFDAITEIVAAAALLHDITHIPYGHTLEDELQDIYLKHDALESPRFFFLLFDPRSGVAQLFDRPRPYLDGLDNHALRWLIYLTLAYREEPEAAPPRSFPALLARARCFVADASRFNAQTRRSFAAFLDEAAGRFAFFSGQGLLRPFMTDVVCGTVSADLLDYTARDLYFTGLRGAFDQRIMHYFFIGRNGPTGPWRLALDVASPRGYARLDITSEIMNLMRLRYSMAERVYYHKNKVAASAMLARGLVGHGLPAESNPYDDPCSVLRVDLSDEEMIRRLTHAEVEPGLADACGQDDDGEWLPLGTLRAAEAQQLGWAIYNRQLHVPVVVLTEAMAREAGGPLKYVDLLRGLPDGRKRLHEIQSALSALTGLGAHSVVLYCPPIKMQAKAINVPVRFEENRLLPLSDHPDFSDEAEILNRKYRELWKTFVFVSPAAIKMPGMAAKLGLEFCRRLDISPTLAKRICINEP